MTRVCASCGWLLLRTIDYRGVPRCPYCNGIAVSMKSAREALKVETTQDVIMASPARRAVALRPHA